MPCFLLFNRIICTNYLPRGEVMNGGFGLILDGTEVSFYSLHFFIFVSVLVFCVFHNWFSVIDFQLSNFPFFNNLFVRMLDEKPKWCCHGMSIMGWIFSFLCISDKIISIYYFQLNAPKFPWWDWINVALFDASGETMEERLKISKAKLTNILLLMLRWHVVLGVEIHLLNLQYHVQWKMMRNWKWPYHIKWKISVH